MHQPLVSIHLMTYNQIDFIADTIDSALSQTYDAIEIVIGDDGSTDGTAEVVAKYAKKHPDRIKLAGGEHAGINENANRILRACTGEYVALLNGDDLFCPEKIARQVAWMEADPRRVLCAHDTAYFHEDPDDPYTFQSRITPPRQGVGARDFLHNGCPFAAVSVMVRASVVPEYGFDPQLKAAMDWKMWVDCLADGGHFGYVDGVLAKYRMHPNNTTSTQAPQMWLDRFAGLGLVEARHPELADACQRSRARVYYQKGVGAAQRQDLSAARSALLKAMRYDPRISWKLYGWLAYNEVANNDHPLMRLVRRAKRRLL